MLKVTSVLIVGVAHLVNMKAGLKLRTFADHVTMLVPWFLVKEMTFV